MKTIVTNSVLALTTLPADRTAGNYRYTLHGGPADEIKESATPEVTFEIAKSGSYSVALERLLNDGTVWGSAVVSNVLEFVAPTVSQDNAPASVTISFA